MISPTSALPHLFKDGLTTYAILDGAQAPDLRQNLHASGLEFICLYRGEIPDDLAQVAPYLVALKREHNFTAWILERGWGHSWGIFARAEAAIAMPEIRKHFRKFLLVEFPDRKPRYFRYYDPRVLNNYLPTCNQDEVRTLLGPLNDYIAESLEPGVATRYSAARGLLCIENLRLE